MAWLTVCPFHKLGVFGLLVFFITIYNQVTLHQPATNQLTTHSTTKTTQPFLINTTFLFNKNYAF